PTGKEFHISAIDNLTILNGGELVVEELGKFGLVDTMCRELLPVVYDQITLPNDNHYLGYYGPYAISEKDGKKGIYASGSGIRIRPEWDGIRVYDNYFVLERDAKFGLYDQQGRELLAPVFSDITHVN